MQNSNAIERIKELTEVLNRASSEYYSTGNEIMPNIEYDRLYDELVSLEEETGFSADDSPTKNVGSEVRSELPKERHKTPMLSLDKTKSVDELKGWLGSQPGVLSWKLDGLTVVLTYAGGRLVKAVTRGNGEIGELITENALNFENLPHRIDYDGSLVVRGEAVISYRDFELINESIDDADAKYKNPRNLCSGSVRQLDPAVTRSRHVNFYAFGLVSSDREIAEYSSELDWLKSLGFTAVEYIRVTADSLADAVEDFKSRVTGNPIPSDGLVLMFDDIEYGKKLGHTAKYPRNALAFKWQDETAETVLLGVEWSASRTGLINPVAVFEPVELEGTTVSRASVHNLSIVRELKLGAGDHILVYKANMIIPQISENLTGSGNLDIPERCPVCGGETCVRSEGTAEFLCCTNPSCPAKRLKAFSLMVSRDALNIEGLSEMTLSALIGAGCIREYADIFSLERYKNEIVALEGFGEKSFDKLISSVRKAADTQLYRFVYGLGIPGIGLANARLICRYFGNDYERIKRAGEEELTDIGGIGAVLAQGITEFFKNESKTAEADRLYECLHFKEEAAGEAVEFVIGGQSYSAAPGLFAGKAFVITGEVYKFSGRRELSALIEKLGGRVSGSVSGKTDYLINNDSASSSAKNKKAGELGIPVITEEEFIRMLE